MRNKINDQATPFISSLLSSIVLSISFPTVHPETICGSVQLEFKYSSTIPVHSSFCDSLLLIRHSIIPKFVFFPQQLCLSVIEGFGCSVFLGFTNSLLLLVYTMAAGLRLLLPSAVSPWFLRCVVPLFCRRPLLKNSFRNPCGLWISSARDPALSPPLSHEVTLLFVWHSPVQEFLLETFVACGF